MSTWITLLLTVMAILFMAKLIFLLTAGGVLPLTKGALFVPTSRKRIRAFLDAVPMLRNQRLIDLGCGDGRVLRAAYRRYGIRGTGFEINPLAWSVAKLQGMWYKGIKIRWGNFWDKDLGNADLVFCYFFPDVMDRVGEKLRSELSNGSRVVSCNFPIPKWRPKQVVRPASDRHGDPIYIYEFPAALTDR
jgi:hypothetical protein